MNLSSDSINKAQTHQFVVHFWFENGISDFKICQIFKNSILTLRAEIKIGMFEKNMTKIMPFRKFKTCCMIWKPVVPFQREIT